MTFYEIIDGLIDAGDLLLNEQERVPSGKRSDKNYTDARDTIHQELSSVQDVEAGCYHESAHFVYSTFFGAEQTRPCRVSSNTSGKNSLDAVTDWCNLPRPSVFLMC
jgi:hypothetical protein